MSTLALLSEILREPMGPFHDRWFLTPDCSSLQKSKMLTLYNFMLAHNDEITGLDISEDPERDEGRIRFRGVLCIESLSWMTASGRTRVQAELEHRLQQRAVREGERQYRELQLIDLFDEATGFLGTGFTRTTSNRRAAREAGLKLKVRIQGEKGMPAVYMISNDAPGRLLWNSADRLRRYVVFSMEKFTLKQSGNYLLRYRLLAGMAETVKTSPKMSFSKRTLGWFVDQYIQQLAFRDVEQHRRLIFDPDNPGILDETGATATPRHRRRTDPSLIRVLFATHGDWLLTEDVVKRWSLFDPKVWEKDLNKLKESLRRSNITWGWAFGVPPEHEGRANATTTVRAVVGKSKQQVERALANARQRPQRPASPTRYDSSPASSDDEVDNKYDSDFSGDTSSEETDSEDGHDEPFALTPEQRAKIPKTLLQRPEPPGGDGLWRCPVPDCEFELNMLNLTMENVRNLDQEVIHYLMAPNRKWGSIRGDPIVLEGFECMVDEHYDDHLCRLGIYLRRVR